ncbi:hypothetical protein [Sediminitomix flava]|uniref:Uncharacterized protein n=1 Tax=Sediminitomix flava TaxID=379075 RepID=A0A315Z4W7_SEDFL|nr:hypothetical protein [Sediminitomix flava]PWJ38523.1 hypothetical protein BC781_107113 [Sediminitomix flava]
MIPLRKLVQRQFAFAVFASLYLLGSLVHEHFRSVAFIQSPVLPSFIILAVYTLSLLLSKKVNKKWYRIAMIPAILFFGGLGVVGNLILFMNSGLAYYSSYNMWLIALGINFYGSMLNIFALLGLYKE